jgi:hypothetical protein
MILGYETPRIFTPPRRELTPETTHGFACIAFAEEVLEVKLFPWQRWLLLHALELDEATLVPVPDCGCRGGQAVR